jgi:hypothetical protein
VTHPPPGCARAARWYGWRVRKPYLLVSLALAPLFCLACSSSSSGSSGADGGTHVDAGAPGDAGMDVASHDAPAPDAPPSTDAGGSSDAPQASDASVDGEPPDVSAPLADGGLLVQFVKSDQTVNFDSTQQTQSTGTVTFGVANTAASDDNVATLTRMGGQATIGTGGAEEIVSQRAFSFGTFSFRLSLATCASTEEVVNGPFAYFNDGSLAADGLVINREVDIEVLCGEPWLINLTIWTEYTDDQSFRNQSRVVDTKTGTLYVYADDQSGNETGSENHPELLIPGWPQAGTFYEMGWTWTPTDLRYFLVVNGVEVTLWDATDATRIPQAPMEQHFNIWAPGQSWSTGDPADVPADDATLTLDWFRYDPG